MPLILLVEPEGRWVERIRDAVGGEGIRVKAVNEREAALRSVAEEAPDLVLVNHELSGAADLISAFGRGRGGPGVVALVGERSGAASTGADEELRKPFTDQDLRLLIKRQLSTGRSSRRPLGASAPAGDALSSRELFADLLAEVEREGGGEPITPPAPARPPAPPSPVKPAAAPHSPAATVEAKLEQTLSGLMEKPRPREVRPGAAGRGRNDDVDSLLSATLSGLKLGTKPRQPSPPPAVSAVTQPFATPKPAPPPPPPPVAAKPAAVPAAAAPAAESAPPPPPVTPGTPVKSKPPRRDASPVAKVTAVATPPSTSLAADFATQRVPVMRPGGLAKAEAGREFGPYTLLERIAVGGMAEVWKARRGGLEGFQKLVAIKRILPHLNDSPDFVAMLIDEAKLAAQLTHPNITQIYDLGKIGDDHYIAMEFVDGKDLRAVLNTLRARGETLPQGIALLIAARLAGALDYAHHKRDFEGHELGLVHRDVSPQNVLISHDGVIKLCDFGIVKAVSRAHQTQMGALKGKLQYMSPEQAWGRRVDGRSDVFSLGSLLYEMLSGRRVFAGDTEISILESVREGRVPRLADVAPDVPEPIQAVVARALERDPEDRFATAAEMQRELERLAAEARPVPSEAEIAAVLRRLFGTAAGEAPMPPAAATPAHSTASGAAAAGGSGVRPAPVAAADVSVPVVMPAPSARPAAAKSRTGLWIGVAAAAVVAVGLALMLTRNPPLPPPAAGEPSAAVAPAAEPDAAATAPAAVVPSPDGAATTGASASSSPTATDPSTAPASPPGGATPLGETAAAASGDSAGLARLVDQEFAKREQALRQQYESEKKRLEEQLRLARSQSPAAAASTAAGSDAVAGSPLPASPSPVPAPEEPQIEAVTPPAAVAPPAETAAADSEPAAPAPVEAIEPPPRPAPPVEAGSLVAMGPGVAAPQLVSRLEPRYPALARSRRVEASVTVEVLVDERGVVTQTRLLKGDDRGLGFNEAALAAAQVARFRPATKNGVPVKMWKALVFPFQM